MGATRGAVGVPAALGKRLGARLVDALIAWLPMLPFLPAYFDALASAAAAQPGSLDTLADSLGRLAIGSSLSLVVGLVQIWLLGAKGWTLGKRLMGISLVDASTGAALGLGRAFLRELMFVLLTGVVFLGIISIFLDSTGRRAGWHDKMLNANVVDGLPRGASSSVPRPASSSVGRAVAPPAVPQPPLPFPGLGTATAPSAPPMPAYLGAPVPPPAPAAGYPPAPAAGYPPAPAAGYPPAPTPGYPAAPGQGLAPVPAPPAPIPFGAVPPAPPPPAAAPPAPARTHTPAAAPVPAAPVPPAPAGDATLITSVPGNVRTAATPVSAPAAAPAAPVVSEPRPSGSLVLDEELELTRLRPETPAAPAADDGSIPASALLRISDGRELTITGTVLIGRNPAAGEGEEVGELVRVSDPGRSVSKTHVMIGVDADGVWAADRASTNGTVVTLADGQQIICAEHQVVRLPEGASVTFGDYSVSFEFRRA